MAAPIAPAVRMSAEEFYARYSDDDLAKRYELVDGEVLPLSPTNPRHDIVVGNILFALGAYVRPRRLGHFTTGQGGFQLNVPGRRGDTVRGPDVSFTVTARLRDRFPERGFGRGAPDLAVEVRSPDDTAAEVARRRDDLFADGARLFWDVDRWRRTVAVHAPGSAPRTLGTGDVLDGGDVIPGLAVPVAELFDGLDALED